jgi:iron complex transport system permease protein
MLTALKFGSVNIGFKEIFGIIAGKTGRADDKIIITAIRMPRIVYAVLVGGMLGLSGAILQAVLKNPLADPFVTGISSGAAFGAVLSIIAGFTFIMIPSAALGIITILVVYRLSIIYGRLNITYLLLTGVMIGSLFSGLIMLLSTIFNKDLMRVMFWLMGDLSGADVSVLKYALIFAFIAFAGAMYFANDLNILSTGEEEAGTVGVNVELVKTIYFIIASLLTGISVSLSGVIGFVGLVIPHVMRIFIGSDMRWLMPASFITGGIFLLLADTIARTIFLPAEIPVGIITGLIGAPVFIFILLTKRGI